MSDSRTLVFNADDFILLKESLSNESTRLQDAENYHRYKTKNIDRAIDLNERRREVDLLIQYINLD